MLLGMHAPTTLWSLDLVYDLQLNVFLFEFLDEIKFKCQAFPGCMRVSWIDRAIYF